MLAAVLFAATTILVPVFAQASPSPATGTAQAKAIDDCLKADNVWVFVITEDETVLSNQCVDSPASGAEALDKAGVTVQNNKTGLICTMNDHPATCPKTFTGQYWAYYHASGAGAPWEYSQKGADQYKPAAGSIEGWCYNKPKTKSCTPPKLAAGSAEGSSFNLTTAHSTGASSSNNGVMSGPVATIAVIAVIVIVLVAALLVRRRHQS
ncbi:hypothetical protein FYJ43_08610 [Cutibacterium sp. WCA-380-WT-3A]|uniref:Uncharacterized protein n=1 Tax=Cutibacterium porci TaxID=2605781 RepID=A0A7K0J806_9ACTN|nr:hypothetical protein [Cutibacterium porci]